MVLAIFPPILYSDIFINLEGKKMTIKMKFKTDKNILVVFSIENKYTLESRAKK